MLSSLDLCLRVGLHFVSQNCDDFIHSYHVYCRLIVPPSSQLPRASRIGILQQGVELARSQATAQETNSEGEAPKEQGEKKHTCM